MLKIMHAEKELRPLFKDDASFKKFMGMIEELFKKDDVIAVVHEGKVLCYLASPRLMQRAVTSAAADEILQNPLKLDKKPEPPPETTV